MNLPNNFPVDLHDSRVPPSSQYSVGSKVFRLKTTRFSQNSLHPVISPADPTVMV